MDARNPAAGAGQDSSEQDLSEADQMAADGFSELRESDSADALVQRADSDLLSRRGHSPRPSPSS
jgi:hypothetical protein